MKIDYRLLYFLIMFSISCFSQEKKVDKRESFSQQFLMNSNVSRQFKKYANNDTIIIIDPDKHLTDKDLTYISNDLKILIYTERRNHFDFIIKKVIIDPNLAFVVMWNKDSVTALCFYPFLSEFTANKWIIEEITTRSIK